MLWLVIFPKKSRILESGQKGHLVLSAKIFLQECIIVGTFLAAQWLKTLLSSAGGCGLDSSHKARFPHA